MEEKKYIKSDIDDGYKLMSVGLKNLITSIAEKEQIRVYKFSKNIPFVVIREILDSFVKDKNFENFERAKTTDCFLCVYKVNSRKILLSKYSDGSVFLNAVDSLDL